MATTYLSPLWGAGAQLFDLQGVVLAGGKIKTFLAGTTTPAATFTDSTGSVSNGTVITLDSSGRPPGEIWLTAAQPYKFQLTDLNDVQIGPLFDFVSGVNDPGGGVGGSSVWTVFSGTPSYISATQFSVTGNQTATFPVGTRVRSTVTAGTAYGTVSAVAFGTFTTVTLINDGTTLDSGLSAVAVSINAVVGANVSAASVDYKVSLTYPPNTVGAALQSQNLATTTTGTSTAYVLTPSTPITSYVSGQPFLVKFNQASGANPTINVSAQGAKNLMQYNSAGTKIAAVVYTNQIAYVVYDGTDMVVIEPVRPSGALLRITVFNSSGTWTRGADVGFIVVEGVGGGGGGGGSGGSGDAGGGGGSGGYFKKLIATPNATETVTIGAGGASLTVGGNTVFVSYATGFGGLPGGGRAGGAGGSATGGDINQVGGPGGWGGSNDESSFGGSGGSSVLGGGAAATTGHAATGVDAAANSGGGGSGGVNAGGAGGAGRIVVYEYSK